MKFYPLIFLVLILFGCGSQKNLTSLDPEVNALKNLMTGSFDSSSQANSDTSYFDISLHMYPIWQKTGEAYIYVEQAVSAQQNKPYRQRIYKLSKEGTQFISKVYTLQNEEDFIGKWRTPDFFDKYKPEELLIEREGCAVYLRKFGDSYIGKTQNTDCRSNLRGASYATSVVTVKSGQIESWDRGFDSQNKQVWGATNGAYIFNKK